MHDAFHEGNRFQDDVWGPIRLNSLERDVVDTPEFQRLFRTSQLGFVDLVYQTANHTRGAHSIGTCHVASMLIDRLIENQSMDSGIKISESERVLIRLGALLHDISHVPLSHDVERKKHRIRYRPNEFIRVRSYYGKYDKHDDYDLNPLLYILIFDRKKSILARVLSLYSKAFCECLQRDVKKHAHLSAFGTELDKVDATNWDPAKELLPSLLFHLLTYEDAKDAKDAVREIAVRFDRFGKG